MVDHDLYDTLIAARSLAVEGVEWNREKDCDYARFWCPTCWLDSKSQLIRAIDANGDLDRAFPCTEKGLEDAKDTS